MLKNMWKAIFICLLLTLGTFSQKRLSIFCGFRGFGTQSGTGGETAPVPWDVYRAACRRRFAPIGTKNRPKCDEILNPTKKTIWWNFSMSLLNRESFHIRGQTQNALLLRQALFPLSKAARLASFPTHHDLLRRGLLYIFRANTEIPLPVQPAKGNHSIHPLESMPPTPKGFGLVFWL